MLRHTGVNTIKIILLTAALLLCTCGCWDRHELDSLAITTGVAIDKSTTAGSINMTVQVIDLGTLGPTPGKTIAAKPYWNIKTSGDTIFDCVRNCSQQSPHRLYWAHNQVVLISEEVAREDGLKKYLDLLLRNPESRVTTWLLISKGSAEEVLDTQTRLEPIPAISIATLMENCSITGKSVAIDFFEFTTRILSESTAPICSLITVIGEGEEKSLFISGTAVFDRETKMIGTLNETETRGLLWVSNEIKSGIIIVEAPQCTGNVSIEIINSKSKITPEITDGSLKIKVQIKEKGILGDTDCTLGPLDIKTWESLNSRQAEAIREDIMLSLAKAQELDTDIFGFGDAVYKKYPQEWKKIKPDWEEIFPTLEVEVQVDSKLCRPGMILQSVNTN